MKNKLGEKREETTRNREKNRQKIERQNGKNYKNVKRTVGRRLRKK